jgi:uncharacterized protein YodC (DUF2158 family)
MADDFNVGDVVMLKSGGPAMTIEEIGEYSAFGVAGRNQAKCVWFEGTKRKNHKSAIFEFSTLTKSE